MIQSAISRILKLLPGKTTTQADRDEYNRQSDFEYERIRDFLILHYHANARDEPFWQASRERPIPETLAHKLRLWRGNGHITREHEELFTEVGWFQVLVGQGIIPAGTHPMTNSITRPDLQDFMEAIAKLHTREVMQMPDHSAFVAQHCAAREAVMA